MTVRREVKRSRSAAWAKSDRDSVSNRHAPGESPQLSWRNRANDKAPSSSCCFKLVKDQNLMRTTRPVSLDCGICTLPFSDLLHLDLAFVLVPMEKCEALSIGPGASVRVFSSADSHASGRGGHSQVLQELQVLQVPASALRSEVGLAKEHTYGVRC